MTGHRRTMALLLLAGAFVLAFLGQIYFFLRRDYLWDGLVFHLLGALCFLLAWRTAASRDAATRAARRTPWTIAIWIREQSFVAALLSLGLFAALIAALLARDRSAYQPAGDVVALWLIGLGAVSAGAFLPSVPRRPSDGGPDHPIAPQGQPERVAVPSLRRRLSLRLHRFGRGAPIRAWAGQRDARLEFSAVVVLTVLAAWVRMVGLDRIPYTLGGDEAWHGLLARQVLRGELRNPFAMGYMSMPTFFYWPLAGSLWFAGDHVAGLRWPAALAGTATIPLLYLLTRRLWGQRTALLAAAFLASYDYHIHFSRLGANNVWDPLLTVLILWLLDRALVNQDTNDDPARGGDRRKRSSILAGLVMGLAVLFYTGARLVPWLVVAYTTFVYAKHRLQRRPLPPGLVWRLALLTLAFFIAAAPMLSYALAHPGEWNARVSQVGIIQSGWLEREPGLTGKSVPQILIQQFLMAAGAFHAFPDRTVWYGAARPLLGFLAGLMAIFGLAWALAHWRERRSLLILVWFWGVIIVGGMLTESPPSSQRLVMAIPPVVLFVVTGLEQALVLLWRLLLPHPHHRNEASGPGPAPDPNRAPTRSPESLSRSSGPRPLRSYPKGQSLVLVLITLILAASSIRYYFIEIAPARRYGSENGETATMMGYYLRDLGGDVQVYLLGAPRLYWSFGTMAFLAPQASGQDIVDPLSAPPDLESWGRPAVFIFLPERIGELAWVRQSFPGGREQEFHDAAGKLRFLAYELQP